MRVPPNGDFASILSPAAEPDAAPSSPVRDQVLHDLALDQVFDRIGEQAPRAASAYAQPLTSLAAISYRQQVFGGLEHPALRAAVEGFLQGMKTCATRDGAVAGSHDPLPAALWQLHAVSGYVETVEQFHAGLAGALRGLAYACEGWAGLARQVGAYRASPAFARLKFDTEELARDFTKLRYNVLIRGAKVTIAPTDDEPSLAEAVAAVFARFRQGEVLDHRTPFRPPSLDHVQGWVLDRVAELYPDLFGRLLAHARQTSRYHYPLLDRFVDEVRFYLAYLDHLAPMRQAGLPVCYPRISAQSKDLRVDQAWDLALAARLVEQAEPVITNGLQLIDPERILVISGPNQGGKTTTARLFGQLHHLAAIGCPIPGSRAQVFLCDRVLTVFEREENLDTPEGRLGAEVQRLHQVFGEATGRSVIVINEAFASTALHDARILTGDVLERISRLDALAVCVTFIDELSRLNDKTVSMVSTVDPTDPAIRTFRVERRPADGRAYARALAERHGLTGARIGDQLSNLGHADEAAS